MKIKILLVDDEPDIVKVVKHKLEANQYEVVTAESGEKAILKARAEKPNLIILDVMLPAVSGYEICSVLKHDPELRGIPVLILTARIKPADQKIAELCGANAFLPKPYCSELLLDKIDRCLQHV
jgi:two-component system, OmpR family, alkaline phosphatase synthesis response regulator PhoP